MNDIVISIRDKFVKILAEKFLGKLLTNYVSSSAMLSFNKLIISDDSNNPENINIKVDASVRLKKDDILKLLKSKGVI